MKFGSIAVHAGVEPDPTNGAVMTPVYLTSTYAQSAPGVHQGYDYSRAGNPTRTSLEKSLAAIEGAKYGLAFSSGLGATDSVLKVLSPGDEVIATNDLYGGTFRMFTRVFEKYGLKFSFVDMTNPENIRSHFTSKTKMVWVETPTNPLLNIVDIQKIAEITHEMGAWLCVDNTFATPYLQNPLALGADLVMHSATKYIGGHSDIIMGALMTNDEDLYKQLSFYQFACGAVPGPMDCFLALRGIKTLHIRMQAHCKNGAAIAEFLSKHPKVNKVFYPGLASHPNHEIAKKQMRDFGGIVSFSLKEEGLEAATKMIQKMELFTLAESLGGVESLVNHPAQMTHASIPKEKREAIGIDDSLLRLSIGIEDIEDLIADLKKALD